MYILGWIGSILLGLCGIPQSFKCCREKHANGLAWSFIIMWFVGDMCAVNYVIYQGDAPLLEYKIL